MPPEDACPACKIQEFPIVIKKKEKNPPAAMKDDDKTNQTSLLGRDKSL